MNQIIGNWNVFMGKAQQGWGMVTHNMEDLSAGYERVLAGRIQKFYGISKAKAELEVKNWTR